MKLESSYNSSFEATEARPRSTGRRITLAAVLSIVAIVVVLAGIKALQIGAMIKAGKAFVPPPESITSANVESTNWQASRAAIGSLVAVRGVTLGSEVTGRVTEISFDSGTLVQKGSVLIRIDSSAEQAQLESARADAGLAKLNLDRARSLRQTGSNTPAELENAEARSKQLYASVTSLQATLAKRTIRAPFTGRVAIRQVELGQILSPGTSIASLQQVTPIYAEFSLPQQSLAEIKMGQDVKMGVDIFPGSSWSGKVSVINPEVDNSTRNVRFRATFENRDGRLTPGMFANVEVLSSEKRIATVIPATSVIFAPYGDSVYVLEKKESPDGKEKTIARQQFVRLGERRGDFVAVLSGLKEGQSIVSSGAFKLRNGIAVAVNNAMAPAPSLQPAAADK